MASILRTLLFAALAVSLSFPSVPEEVLAFAPFAASQGYSLKEFPYANGSAYAIVSGGEVLSILSGEVPAAVLTEPAEVEGALSAYYVSLGHSPEAFDSFLSLHDDVAAIRNNRKAGEAKCRILTGTDRHECTTFEGCQQACYSVTSFCLPVALGSGREFIEIIWAFENNTRALDAAYENEDRRFAALSSARDGDSSLAYLSALFEVNRAATAA